MRRRKVRFRRFVLGIVRGSSTSSGGAGSPPTIPARPAGDHFTETGRDAAVANLPDAMENRVTAYVAAGTTPAALTTPMRVRLLSALGASDAAGTAVTTGTTPWVNFGATVTADTATNAAILRWEGLPNPTTVAGFQVGDSAATPVITLDNIARTGGSVSVTGGIFEVAAGGLTVTSA